MSYSLPENPIKIIQNAESAQTQLRGSVQWLKMMALKPSKQLVVQPHVLASICQAKQPSSLNKIQTGEFKLKKGSIELLQRQLIIPIIFTALMHRQVSLLLLNIKQF